MPGSCHGIQLHDSPYTHSSKPDPPRSSWWKLPVVAALLTAPILLLYAPKLTVRPRSSCPAARVAMAQLGAGPSDSGPAPVLQRPQLLLFGDSLTERSFDPDGGWGAFLAHHYARKVDVVNRGFGGYNSRQGRLIFDTLLRGVMGVGPPPLAMTLWFGANDAALPERDGSRQHVPVEEYTTNLKHIIAAAQQAGVEHLLLITPPPVHEPGRVAHQQMRKGSRDPVDPDRTLAGSKAYAAAVVQLGATTGLPVLDLWTRLQQEPGWQEQLLLPDGLHFSGAGQALVGCLVVEALAAAAPHLRRDALPNQLPWWDKWDAAAPANTWQALLDKAGSSSSQQEEHQAPAGAAQQQHRRGHSQAAEPAG